MTFGLYKGKSLGEIAVENLGYIRWMMRKELINIDVDAFSLEEKWSKHPANSCCGTVSILNSIFYKCSAAGATLQDVLYRTLTIKI